MASARAASTASRFARNWADCSVYIKISPRPSNIGESKEVLRVLQQYGEVVMYRHLKYEAPNSTPNAALAIYQSEHSARNAVDDSPIRFQSQQRKCGWTSQSWQDIVSEGTIAEASRRGDIRVNEKVDGNDQRTGDFDAGGERINGEEPGEEWEYPASYPYSDSPEIEGNALIGPEKWGSRYISESPVKELTLFKSTEEAPPKISALSTEYPRTASEERRKKLTKQSAQRLAETLTKERDTRSSSKAPKEREEQKPPVREFELTIAKSIFNHEAYIERQAYYAGFNPDMRTIMSEDLRGRAPLEGHLDCSLKKPDVPLRIRLRRQETARPQVSLMELWERGKRERGEI